MTVFDIAEAWDMPAARELPDGTIAGIQRLMFTWSVVLGIDPEGESWRYRFCFRDQADALAALASVASERDVPEGWIACRPRVDVIGDDGLPRYPTPAELRALRSRAQA